MPSPTAKSLPPSSANRRAARRLNSATSASVRRSRPSSALGRSSGVAALLSHTPSRSGWPNPFLAGVHDWPTAGAVVSMPASSAPHNTRWLMAPPGGNVCSRGVKGQGQRTKTQGQRTKDKGQRTKDKGQRTKDKGQRTKDKGQRTKDKGQRTKDKGQRTKDKGRRDEESSLLCGLGRAVWWRHGFGSAADGPGFARAAGGAGARLRGRAQRLHTTGGRDHGRHRVGGLRSRWQHDRADPQQGGVLRVRPQRHVRALVRRQ